jgi:light-regulated signal transduction histidine kinase (bacteriophytochrome)
MKINSKTIGLLTHDLKGPVGNISMFTQLLTGSIEEAQEELGDSFDFSAALWQAKYIQVISQKFIDQLQNWADLVFLSEDAIVFTHAFVDLSSLTDQIYKENEIFWSKKQLNINKEIQPNLICKADSDAMRRCLDNLFQLVVLLSNNRSEIGIRVSEIEQTEDIKVTFSGLKNQDYTLFSSLYLNSFSLASDDSFLKGIIKTTGAGLAYCGMMIRYYEGSPFAVTTETGLEFGFTIKQSKLPTIK